MAQETPEQRLFRRVKGELSGAHSTELKLAQIADNKSLYATKRKFKSKRPTYAQNSVYATQEEQDAKMRLPQNTAKYRIRILGEHDKTIPTTKLEWCWPQLTSGPNPMWDMGKSFLPKDTWVYVYQDPISEEYFIDRVSPNSVCEVDPKKSGFQPGDSFLLVPDTMFMKKHKGLLGRRPAGIPKCAEVTEYQVESESDQKQNNVKEISPLVFSTWCRVKGSKDSGSQIGASIEKG